MLNHGKARRGIAYRQTDIGIQKTTWQILNSAAIGNDDTYRHLSEAPLIHKRKLEVTRGSLCVSCPQEVVYALQTGTNRPLKNNGRELSEEGQGTQDLEESYT
jgi:hypothetical protein